jgi:hypothetical protein
MHNLSQLDLGIEILIGSLQVVGHYVDSSGINVFNLCIWMSTNFARQDISKIG